MGISRRGALIGLLVLGFVSCAGSVSNEPPAPGASGAAGPISGAAGPAAGAAGPEGPAATARGSAGGSAPGHEGDADDDDDENLTSTSNPNSDSETDSDSAPDTEPQPDSDDAARIAVKSVCLEDKKFNIEHETMSEATSSNVEEEQAERLRELAALGMDELVKRQAKAAETLIEVRGGLAEAVTREDYAVAAGLKTKEGNLVAEVHELKEAHATASDLRKQRAREGMMANTTESVLPLATDMIKTTDKVWEEHIREVLISLEPSLHTVQMLVQHCLSLVAAVGIQAFSIRPPMSIYNHGVRTGLLKLQDTLTPIIMKVNPDSGYKYKLPQKNLLYGQLRVLVDQALQTQPGTSLTELMEKLQFPEEYVTAMSEFETVWRQMTFIVDLGFCWIPVGKGLTEVQYAEFYSFHEAIAGRPCEIEQDAYMAMTTTFDYQEEVLLNFQHLRQVVLLNVGRLNLRWQLHQAGYVCTISKTISGHDGAASKYDAWVTVAFGAAGNLLRSMLKTSEERLVDKSSSFLNYTQSVLTEHLTIVTKVGLKKFLEEEKLQADDYKVNDRR